MNKQLITRAAIQDVVREYWSQYKAKPLVTLFGFFFPAIGTILIFYVPPLIIARIVDTFLAQGAISFSGVTSYIVLFGVLWLLGEACWRIGYHFLNRLKARALHSLTMRAFRKISFRDYSFYVDNFSGSIVKKGMEFSNNFAPLTDTLNYNVINNIVQIIFATIVLWKYAWWLPAILVGSIGIAICIAVPIIRKRMKYVVERNEASSKKTGAFSDAITNMIAIKSFAQEEEEYRRYSTYAVNHAKTYLKAADFQNQRFDTIFSPIYVLTNVIGLIAAIALSSKLGLAAGAIIVIFTYFSNITRIFWHINGVYREIESIMSVSAEFTELLVEPAQVQDAPNASMLDTKDTSITFDHVGFGYEGNGVFLKDFKLHINANQKVGLVGPSGSGKTTITKLLLRFIDVQEGSVMIGGQNIKNVTQRSLRESIAYVPQEPLLFHRSLFENIAYGDPQATQEQVIAAAKLAHAHEFIATLPKGYQTLVGERGIKLSGGQRQRIAIARALLKTSPILVLDEATSSLDSESEKYIQEGLVELMKNKTAVVIAHRLSTIKHMDRIIVLDNGKVVQDGTHEQLIKKKGLYAKLWSHQSGEFLEE